MSFYKNHNKEVQILFDMLKGYMMDNYDFEANSLDDIKIKSRKRPIVIFRRMMMTILGEAFLNKCTQDDVASVVGLDRTSFIHHYKAHMNDYSVMNSYKEQYDKLRDSYLEKIGVE